MIGGWEFVLFCLFELVETFFFAAHVSHHLCTPVSLCAFFSPVQLVQLLQLVLVSPCY